ncbi:(2,3-dihydroxybenzoyl)adenylate synthase [Frankia tisae]|nr:AMP-binding protein [Frankia tisae]
MHDRSVSWPPADRRRHRAAGYWDGLPLDRILDDAARRFPDRTALVAGDRRWTYRQLVAEVETTAGRLRARGLGAGDRVVVQLPNIAAFPLVCFALLRLGALPVLALPAQREAEIVPVAARGAAVAYVTAERHQGYDYADLAATVRREVPSIREVMLLPADGQVAAAAHTATHPGIGAGAAAAPGTDDPDRGAGPAAAGDAADPPVALFLLSGGTTGIPKLIPRTHDDYRYNARTCAQLCGFDESTVYLAALPVAHNFALACPGILGTFAVGGTVVLAVTPSPDEIFPLIERERVTVTAVVPALARLWAATAALFTDDRSSLRLVQVGGARLDATTARQLAANLDVTVQQVFGMAEGLICLTRPDDPVEVTHETQGRPISPGDEVRIVDAGGSDVVDGEVGELLTRGPYTIRGYHEAPEANARAFTPAGFYRSGDLVRRTAQGNLVIEGRIAEVVNRAGEKISVGEVEEHLLAHPDIRDVAVLGLADPLLGERSCAVVVARGQGLDRVELSRFLLGRGLARFKVPDQVEVVTQLPRTAIGKTDRAALSAHLLAT